MAHVRPLLQEGASSSAVGDAGLHGVGVDDQIIGAALEEDGVAEQQRQLPQGMAPLPMTREGGHGQLGSGLEAGQQVGERRIGSHRRQAWHQARVQASPHHIQHQPLEHGHQRLARQRRQAADQGEENGQKDVEVVPQQAAAAGGAGDPQVALDPEGLLRQNPPQRPQLVPLVRRRRVPFAVQLLLLGWRVAIGLDQGIVDGRCAEQIRHQPATAVAHQSQPGAGGQAPGQSQGVVDRTDGEGVLFKAVDPLAEGTLQQGPDPDGWCGQLAKAPPGAGARPVHKHQQSLGGPRPQGGVIRLEGSLTADRTPAPAVQARRGGQAVFDPLEQQLGRQPRRADRELLHHGFAQPIPCQRFDQLFDLPLNVISAEGEAVQPAEQPGWRHPPLPQVPRGRDRRAAVLHELQHHHLLVGQVRQGRHRGAGLSGRGGEGKGAIHPHIGRGEEVVSGRLRICLCAPTPAPAARPWLLRQQGQRGRVVQLHPPQGGGGEGGLGGGGRRHDALLRRGWKRRGWLWCPGVAASADSWWRAGSGGWRRASRGRWLWGEGFSDFGGRNG